MAKFSGRIGFAEIVETVPGVYREQLKFRNYKGDVLKNYRRYDSGEGLNDNLNINNSLSIVADSFCYENLGCIRCVEWMGTLWKVSSIDLSQRPRIIFEVGGVYNESEIGTSGDVGESSGESECVFPTR